MLKKLLISLGIMLIVGTIVVLFVVLRQQYEGEITIKVYNSESLIVAEGKHEFFKKTKFTELIEKNYDAKLNNGFVDGISGLENDYPYYIFIYIDDVLSEFGINDIILEDGKVYSFKLQDMNEVYSW